MTLELEDFIAETDGVELEDFPPKSQNRIDDALADLTDGEGGPENEPENPPDSVVVSKDPEEDDFTTINGAIDAEDTESGDVIFVKPGTYEEDILLGKDDVSLVGAEGIPTIKSTGEGYQEDGDPVAPLEIVGSGVDVENVAVEAVEDEGFGYGIQVSGVSGASDVTLKNVTVHGSSGFNTGEFGTGVRVRGAPNTVLEGVEVNGGSDVDYGIRVQESGTEVVGCTVNNCNRAIDVQSGDQLVKDNTVNGITEDSPGGFYKDPFDDGLEDDTFPSGKGIRVSTTPSGSNNTVENNEINDCAPGIEAFGSNSTLGGNDINGCSTGITVANGASNYTIEDNDVSGGDGRGISVFSGSTDAHTIQGNTVSDHEAGIVLSGADNNTLSGNEFTGNTFNGIWLNNGAGSATGNTIENNTVSNNGFASAGPYPGIYLGSAEDTTISGNDIDGNAAQGVYVFESPETVVDGNTLADNGEGTGEYIYSGIYCESVTDLTITDNTLDENYYRGIWVSGYTEPLTVSGNSINLRYPDYYNGGETVLVQSSQTTTTLSTERTDSGTTPPVPNGGAPSPE